ncbi:MAG: hypothetical protein IJ976_07575, partial [Alistipes sp.]|nr:hypothetical protein [Alistipes sp.]
VRDGLKPVHRRILYTMHENGLYPEKAFRKCADTVGSVLGSSIYGWSRIGHAMLCCRIATRALSLPLAAGAQSKEWIQTAKP